MLGQIHYSVSDMGGIKVLDLSGSLTVLSAMDFLVVTEKFLTKESLVINLENINFVTVAGLNSLLRLNYYAKEREKRIIFLYPPDNLQDLINNSDNYGYLTFAHSIEECKTKLEFFG